MMKSIKDAIRQEKKIEGIEAPWEKLKMRLGRWKIKIFEASMRGAEAAFSMLWHQA